MNPRRPLGGIVRTKERCLPSLSRFSKVLKVQRRKSADEDDCNKGRFKIRSQEEFERAAPIVFTAGCSSSSSSFISRFSDGEEMPEEDDDSEDEENLGSRPPSSSRSWTSKTTLISPRRNNPAPGTEQLDDIGLRVSRLDLEILTMDPSLAGSANINWEYTVGEMAADERLLVRIYGDRLGALLGSAGIEDIDLIIDRVVENKPLRLFDPRTVTIDHPIPLFPPRHKDKILARGLRNLGQTTKGHARTFDELVNCLRGWREERASAQPDFWRNNSPWAALDAMADDSDEPQEKLEHKKWCATARVVRS
jgi:hypothetical protein